MYHDLLTLGIDLVEVLPALRRGESGYTPRLLLCLIENLDEGSATFASQLGEPAAKGWTSLHDLIIGLYNVIQVNTVVTGQVPKGERKHFEFAESPITKHIARLKAEAAAANKPKAPKRSVLAGSGEFDSIDDLPSYLKS